jgi:hypothetical protein
VVLAEVILEPEGVTAELVGMAEGELAVILEMVELGLHALIQMDRRGQAAVAVAVPEKLVVFPFLVNLLGVAA